MTLLVWFLVSVFGAAVAASCFWQHKAGKLTLALNRAQRELASYPRNKGHILDIVAATRAEMKKELWADLRRRERFIREETMADCRIAQATADKASEKQDGAALLLQKDSEIMRLRREVLGLRGRADGESWDDYRERTRPQMTQYEREAARMFERQKRRMRTINREGVMARLLRPRHANGKFAKRAEPSA